MTDSVPSKKWLLPCGCSHECGAAHEPPPVQPIQVVRKAAEFIRGDGVMEEGTDRFREAMMVLVNYALFGASIEVREMAAELDKLRAAQPPRDGRRFSEQEVYAAFDVPMPSRDDPMRPTMFGGAPVAVVDAVADALVRKIDAEILSDTPQRDGEAVIARCPLGATTHNVMIDKQGRCPACNRVRR